MRLRITRQLDDERFEYERDVSDRRLVHAMRIEGLLPGRVVEAVVVEEGQR
jgi:hypothetical protein